MLPPRQLWRTIDHMELNLFAQAPIGITQASANPCASCAGGGQAVYYYVIARYPSGLAFPVSGAVTARNTAGIGNLSASNFNVISWEPVAGATGYDVFRQSTPGIPALPCTGCAVVLNTSATSVNDTGQNGGDYPPGLPNVLNVLGQFSIDNLNFLTPRLLYAMTGTPGYYAAMILGSTQAGQAAVFNADGTLSGSSASSGGTVTVVGGGSLTSTALVTGGGVQTIQTPSATSILDASGNLTTQGVIKSGGGSTAGILELVQGTAPANVANTITRYAPASVTGYRHVEPGAAATGIPHWSVAGSIVTESVSLIVGADLTSSIAIPGSPTTTTQSPGDNSTKIATTAYVDAGVGTASISDIMANLPAAGHAGRLFIPQDGSYDLLRDTGSVWQYFVHGQLCTLPINTGFAFVNQGGATIVQGNGNWTLTAPLSSSASARMYVKSLPGAPYTITALVKIQGNYANFQRIGLVLRQSGNSHFATFDLIGISNVVTMREEIWTSSTTPTGTIPFSITGIADTLLWMRIVDDGVNRIFSIRYPEQDSATWTQILSESNTANVTPDQYGIFASEETNLYPAIINLLSLTVTTP